MPKFRVCLTFLIVYSILGGTMAFGQNILENDTLYIGNVTTGAGQSIEVPIYIRTTDYYQGWTFPLTFGSGSSPVVCDSVSIRGTIMENWAWTSTFVNNNNWDNTQTCGATGIYVWFGDSLAPGYYLALKLFFTVADTVSPQTIIIDTTTCSFAQGGQQNSYIVVVHLESWLTRIVPGSIIISLPAVDEHGSATITSGIEVFPSIVCQGGDLWINYTSAGQSPLMISLYDVSGRKIDNIYHGAANLASSPIRYQTNNLARGIYYLTIKTDHGVRSAKLVVE